MFKKLSVGIIISGALMFGYCAINTAFVNPAVADELMSSYRARSAAIVSAIVSNEDVCGKCGKKKEECTCEK
ncbi:MAG: hypothetical protein FJ264_11580 [Planctomycetes bacterium]|nr:hypothetical protein [Planctomycetota bacterium]